MWQVIGQDRAVSLFRRSLDLDLLAHAYLLVGPAHVGKMTLAINLAQAVNCEAAAPPCGECASCQKIAVCGHADVQVVGLGSQGDTNGASPKAEISIEQIRQIQHSASLPPFEGRCRVFIIDEAELLSIEAANCLLKTLEEPEASVIFILLTVNEDLLPRTVISRCQRVELMPVAINRVAAALEEKWDVEPERAQMLARLSRGCLGWAVRALEGALLQQRAECLDELLGVIEADCEERFAYVARLVARFGQNRRLLQERLSLWLDWWRDLLLAKVGLSQDVTNVDQLATVSGLAKRYDLASIKGFIDCLRAARGQLRKNANPQLVLETLMLNMPEAGNDEENAAVEPGVSYG